MMEHSPRLSQAIAENGARSTRVQRAERLLDSIYVCLSAHVHGASSVALDDMARSIIQEIGRYRGQDLQ
jgi:hypothetical protein